MISRSNGVLLGLVVAIAGFKATKLVLSTIEVPSCHSTEAINGMIEALANPALGTLAVNNAVTVSGEFSSVRRCTAEIAPLRGGVDATDMRWMRVTYEVRKAADPAKIVVTAELGGETTLAPVRSNLARWVEYFLD